MMEQRVGSCSICGGDVYGFRGVWMSILPPPPDHCISCGAKARGDVIEMVRPGGQYGQNGYTNPGNTSGNSSNMVVTVSDSTNGHFNWVR